MRVAWRIFSRYLGGTCSAMGDLPYVSMVTILPPEQGFVILQVTDHKDGSLGSRNIDLLLPALFKRSGIKRGEDESSVTFVEDGQLTAGERG